MRVNGIEMRGGLERARRVVVFEDPFAALVRSDFGAKWVFGQAGDFITNLANAGGVTTSYFEWVQDRQGYFWKESEVNERLEDIMITAFDDVVLEHMLA